MPVTVFKELMRLESSVYDNIWQGSVYRRELVSLHVSMLHQSIMWLTRRLVSVQTRALGSCDLRGKHRKEVCAAIHKVIQPKEC